MKYIIDIPDDGKCQYRYNEDTKELKFQGPRLDPNSFMGLDITISISGATPYTEPDRKAIEDEVWEFAKELISMSGNEVSYMMECATNFGEVMHNMSYQEAKAKYDAWKQEKEDETIKQKVIDLANDIGIHKLYSMVVDIRGE